MRGKIPYGFFIVLVLVLFFVVREPQTPMQYLTSERTGVTFQNRIEESDSLNILLNEYIYNGGGVGIADFNNDGLEDLFFTGNLVSNELYLNQGQFKFKNVTKIAGIEAFGKWCMGVSIIDINNDGWQDIYISVTGKGTAADRTNILYVHQGLNASGIPIFKDQAAEYGVNDNGFGIHAVFLDYNNDGLIDLYTLNNHFTNRGDVLSKRQRQSKIFEQNRNRLYQNKGNSFEDVTQESGIENDGFSLGVVVVDANNDGWQDIFVSNDFVTSSALYINQKDGTFIDSIAKYIPHQSFNSMGVDVADINNDGLLDLITLDMLPESQDRKKMMFSKTNFLFYDLIAHYDEEPQYMRNCLYVRNSKNYFQEIGQLAGVHQTDWSWAPLFGDFDNDGYKDLYISNGFPRDPTDLDYINFRDDYRSILTTPKELLDRIPQINIPNAVFQGGKSYAFKEVSKQWGIHKASYSYGVATGDLDLDGDLDIVVNNINQDAFVIQNNQHQNNYITIHLKGNTNNPDAVYTQVKIYYQDSLSQMGEVNPYRGYLSSISKNLHFGLG